MPAVGRPWPSDDDDNVFLTMHGAIGELALQTIKHILHSFLLQA